MKSLKHPWARIGIPGPCYRRAVLGAAVTWHVGISLIKGTTLFSFRSVIVMRCKQRECQTSLLQFLDLSFQMIQFSSPVNHHPWLIKPCDSPSKQDISMHGSAAAHTQSQHLGHNHSTKTGCWQNTEGLNHLPWPCCTSGLAETWWLSVAHSSNMATSSPRERLWWAKLLQCFCSQTCALWHFSSFLWSVYLRISYAAGCEVRQKKIIRRD